MKLRNFGLAVFSALVVSGMPTIAFAQEAGGSAPSLGVIGAGFAMALAALGGTLGQGKAISAGLDSIGRNPSASAKIFLPLVLGLALIESLVIFTFVMGLFCLGKI